MVIYHVRIKCLTEIGDGKGFHYYHTEQESLDDCITCSEHPESQVEHFVIEHIEE